MSDEAFNKIKEGLEDAIKMSDAKKILEMIEAVDPQDSDALDEIDELVFKYVTNFIDMGGNILKKDQIFVFGKTSVELHDENGVFSRIDGLNLPSYTRSLDAIVAIQPEGWKFDVSAFCWPCCPVQEYVGGARRIDGTDIHSKVCVSEPLARLHAVIQAIEFERQ